MEKIEKIILYKMYYCNRRNIVFGSRDIIFKSSSPLRISVYQYFENLLDFEFTPDIPAIKIK